MVKGNSDYVAIHVHTNQDETLSNIRRKKKLTRNDEAHSFLAYLPRSNKKKNVSNGKMIKDVRIFFNNFQFCKIFFT